MSQHVVGQYRGHQVISASPGELLIALFDAAVRFGGQAREAIGRGDVPAKARAVDRLIAILAELGATLDHDRAPELCGNLARLYDYLARRVSQAGLTMQTEPLDEVLAHLRRLRDTWVQAVESTATQAVRG